MAQDMASSVPKRSVLMVITLVNGMRIQRVAMAGVELATPVT